MCLLAIFIIDNDYPNKSAANDTSGELHPYAVSNELITNAYGWEVQDGPKKHRPDESALPEEDRSGSESYRCII